MNDFYSSTFVGGAGINIYTLTTDAISVDKPALVNGQRFRFLPSDTSQGGAIQIVVANYSDGAKWLFTPDGYTLASYFDVQKNRTLTIEYRTGLIGGITTSGFVIADEPHNYMSFPNGSGKLQVSGPTSLSFTQNDGKGILIWNPNTSAFRNVNFSTITNSSLFTAANRVQGVINQALLINTLYGVYLYDPGVGSNTLELDFWPIYSGASELWTPTLNELGIYVKRSAVGSSSPDNTRTYLGLLYTASGNISTALGGASVVSRCLSHYQGWRFPFDIDMVTISGFTSTSFVNQGFPKVEWVTEGITDPGNFKLSCNVQNNTAGAFAEMKMIISGTVFNGASFNATSKTVRTTCPVANAWANMSVDWGVAIPIGQYTVIPSIRVSGGVGTFELWMNGTIAL